ncbi:MAG: hypothetical protein R3D84_12435 [Paracoccaceae bacterium]
MPLRASLAAMRLCPALALTVWLAGPAVAAPADVVAAKVTAEAGGTWRFDVTVASDETGWDKYADRWEILAPDGTVLAVRELAHPHVSEQPFTRSLTGVTLPEGVTALVIRAHDKVEGYGGREMTVTLP